LCISVDLTVRFYGYVGVEMVMWAAFIAYIMICIVFYLLGVLTGIVIARATAKENIESL